ncbi:hypothetical protein D9615_006123 [Tricholomella constricta]|uniref:TERF2-interacting telomeric protein 1 Myb domain-containing protein n=1 Tax=Tricholomella constricta TaxID=117010 RepID=A0A8H5HB60_9AGAR|nr:hypothetical protein D9615_006123 [Tricholomella constricta]
MSRYARVPFTSDEDTLLVKYIARYNPGLKGRAGNILYERLCDDVDRKWKWSRTHPWQSWRDRYYKNQVQFDREIKKYQKKHGISDVKLVKGMKVRDDSIEAKKEEEEAEEAQIAPEKRKRGRVEEEEEEEEEEAQIATGKRKRERVEEEKRVKVNSEHEWSQGRRASPGKEQGMFVMGRGTAVADKPGEQHPRKGERSSRSFDDQSEVQKNGTSNVDGDKGHVEQGKLSKRDMGTGHAERAKTGQTTSPSLYPDISTLPDSKLQSNAPPVSEPLFVPGEYHEKLPSQSQNVRHRTHADPQPVASSSKVQLSPGRPASPGTTSVPRRKRQAEDDFFGTSPSSPSPPGRAEHARHKHRLPKLTEGPFGNHYSERRKAASDNDSSDGEKKGKSWPPQRMRHGSWKGKDKASETPQDITGTPAIKSSKGDGKLKSHARLSPNSWTTEDPFIALPAGGGNDTKKAAQAPSELNRRHTIGNTRETQSAFGRRIDLRAELAKRVARSSPVVHSNAHSVTITSHSTPGASTSTGTGRPTPPITTRKEDTRRPSSLLPIAVADEDRERIEYLGVTRAIELIAKNFGFRDEDVWRAWAMFKSIERTEDFFRRFREKTKSVQDAVVEDMEKDGLEIDTLFEEQEDARQRKQEHVPESRQPERERERYRNREITATPGTTDGRSPSRRTQEKDFKIKPLPMERAMSEYTPPYMTRAGQYVRLLKQGRIEEALSREKRRASGGSGVFPRLRSASATQKSPQHRTPEMKKGLGTNEQCGKTQGGGDDQSAEEDDDDAAVEEVLLSDADEEAFLSASMGNASELRMIEQRIDVDYMLRWTATRLAQMRDRFSSLPPS